MDSLQDRINALEIRVPGESDTNLETQIAELNKKIARLYQETPEYGQIYELTGDLKMWGEMETNKERHNLSMDTLNATEDNPNSTNSRALTIEEQKQYILARHPQIVDSYQQIQAIANMDVSRFINYADSLQSVPHFDESKARGEMSKVEAAKLADKVHLMVIKNLIVFEKHLDLITSENQFWCETEERIQAANRRIAALEAEYLLQHKY